MYFTEFRFVQRQLKETVRELLRVKLKGRFPLKGDADINALLRRRMHGSVQEEEWVDIVKYMYNHDDSVEIVAHVLEAIQLHRAMEGVTGGGASRFVDFLSVLSSVSHSVSFSV